MSVDDIPVRVVGPGSQPAESGDDTLSYIGMPNAMSTYSAPELGVGGSTQSLAGAREAMTWLGQALADWQVDRHSKLVKLTALDADSREFVNQILGEGEVSVAYEGQVRARTQESVLAGVWRTLYLDAGNGVLADVLEVGVAPHLIYIPPAGQRAVDASAQGAPDEVVNALPILVELESRCRQFEESSATHTINLSLLPVTPADLEFLDARLGNGPVETLSRAYGKCQVNSTLTPNVWWVRYYNSMGVLILNTLEVTDVPAVLCAAPEDLGDSAERLAEILEPCWPEGA